MEGFNIPLKTTPYDNQFDAPGKQPKKVKARAYASYEVHEPEQDAFGDWAAISVGGQYYLFGDFHPAGTTERHEMSTAWFTSHDINKPFQFCGNVGSGHPDPDIAFAEGQFYLVTQTDDFVSPGPWVEKVEVRVGIDTSNNGEVDSWTEWQEIKKQYDYVEGFAKQVQVTPAAIDLSKLPAAYGVAFEFRVEDTTDNASAPVIDRVILELE